MSHWDVGCTMAKSIFGGGILAGNSLLMGVLLGVVFLSVVVQINPSNLKVMGIWDCCQCCQYLGGGLPWAIEIERFGKEMEGPTFAMSVCHWDIVLT